MTKGNLVEAASQPAAVTFDTLPPIALTESLSRLKAHVDATQVLTTNPRCAVECSSAKWYEFIETPSTHYYIY